MEYFLFDFLVLLLVKGVKPSTRNIKIFNYSTLGEGITLSQQSVLLNISKNVKAMLKFFRLFLNWIPVVQESTRGRISYTGDI